MLTNNGRAPFCQPCPSVRVIATTNAEYRLRTDGRTDRRTCYVSSLSHADITASTRVTSILLSFLMVKNTHSKRTICTHYRSSHISLSNLHYFSSYHHHYDHRHHCHHILFAMNLMQCNMNNSAMAGYRPIKRASLLAAHCKKTL